MKTVQTIFSILALSLILFSCDTVKKSTSVESKPVGDDGILELNILQMNDVYEISPAPSDGSGGLARVATIRQNLLKENPNTLTVLAGDFISPSVTGTLKYEGKRIRGKHMVDVLNTLGLDWVVFGNHEFDYGDLPDLQARLDESKFGWLTGNVRLKPPSATPEGTTFTQQFFKNKPGGGTDICPDNQVITYTDEDGTKLRMGLFGVLVSSGKQPWAVYSDWMESARKSYAELKPKTDCILALTHLDVADDKKLAAMLPGITLIMGGHDHDNQIHHIGSTVVTKADANAKTVYVHKLKYDKKKGKCTVNSSLKVVNGSIEDEQATAAVVAKWEGIQEKSLAEAGIHASNVVAKLDEPLDCREGVIRHTQAPAGKLITDAMFAASKNNPDCVILNSCSIRVDDVLKGSLSELDIVRILPFGGGIDEVEMTGTILRQTLDAGFYNKGKGGYLQLNRITRDEKTGNWSVGGTAIDPNKLYHVTLPDYLLTGNESNLGFLKADNDATGKSNNPGIPKIIKPDSKNKADIRNDIRLVLIQYLKLKH